MTNKQLATIIGAVAAALAAGTAAYTGNLPAKVTDPVPGVERSADQHREMLDVLRDISKTTKRVCVNTAPDAASRALCP